MHLEGVDDEYLAVWHHSFAHVLAASARFRLTRELARVVLRANFEEKLADGSGEREG